MRVGLILCLFTNAKSDLITHNNILCNDRLVQLTVLTDHRIIHNDGITYHGIFPNGYATADYGVVNLTADGCTFTDNTSLNKAGI